LLILVIALVLFYKLRISIGGESLCASFGIGIIRKKVRLRKLSDAIPFAFDGGTGGEFTSRRTVGSTTFPA
jgi:hypothetical protein